MLSSLFGNRNVERILLFLFVNESCYGTQLQTFLGVALTPIQKALIRLEKGGILQSRLQGKTRMYQWSPSYPFRLELEALLKKGYALLSAAEKKRYCFVHKPRLSAKEEGKRERDRNQELLSFWERLTHVKQLSCSTKSKNLELISLKVGKAEVSVISSTPSVLVFQEKGHWLFEELPHTAFSNVFRWTLDLKASLIALEHLRYGAQHPVFLFHFTPTAPCVLESVDPHLCAQDTYLGHILWDPNSIHFHCRILGPHKNDELAYCYQ